MKHTITLKFNKLPKHCGECPLYKMFYCENDGSYFWDGCPFGCSRFGCLIERPNDCPIGTTVEVNEKDKEINSPYKIDKKLFEKLVKDEDFIEEIFDTNYLSKNELIDKINNPKTIEDLKFIAICCHYKDG